MKKITKKEIIERGFIVVQHKNPNFWEYEDEEKFCHLILECRDLTKGLRAKKVYSGPNKDWGYEDEESYYHLFRKNKELTKNIKTKSAVSFSNGEWWYRDEYGKHHHFMKNGDRSRMDNY